jgi:hypothetical protein
VDVRERGPHAVGGVVSRVVGLRRRLGMKDEQERLVVRERRAVGLPGVAPERCDEPFLVRCLGLEPADRSPLHQRPAGVPRRRQRLRPRGNRSIDRVEGAWPNLILVHAPVHASWLNQCEIYFSIVQRKALQPNDFADLDALEQTLLTFGRRYQQIANPFEWKFTRRDLDRVLARLDDHDTAARARTA